MFFRSVLHFVTGIFSSLVPVEKIRKLVIVKLKVLQGLQFLTFSPKQSRRKKNIALKIIEHYYVQVSKIQFTFE